MTDSTVPAARRASKPWSQRVVTLVAGKNPQRTRGNGADAGLGQGMELAITVAIFLGLGWLVDTWVGAFPAFTIGFTVFAMAGASARMWFDYDARMKRLEADRLATKTAHQNPAAANEAANPQASDEKGPL